MDSLAICLQGLKFALSKDRFSPEETLDSIALSLDPHKLHTYLNAAARGPVGEGDSGVEMHEVYVKSWIPAQTTRIQCTDSTTVDELKLKVQDAVGIPASEMRLLYAGRKLQEGGSLAANNVQRESVLHVIMALKGGGQAPEQCIDQSLMDQAWDYDFTNINDQGKVFTRGGETYRRPCGWKRLALKVKDRYESNDWLGPPGYRQHGVDREWPVSYHGTALHNSSSIAQEGFKQSKGKRFAFGHGIYTSPDPDLAAKFATTFCFDGKKYQIMFQNRVNPQSFIRFKSSETGNGEQWVSPDDNDVRPYGFLIRVLPL